jgi:hypothetical protein
VLRKKIVLSYRLSKNGEKMVGGERMPPSSR